MDETKSETSNSNDGFDIRVNAKKSKEFHDAFASIIEILVKDEYDKLKTSESEPTE